MTISRAKTLTGLLALVLGAAGACSTQRDAGVTATETSFGSAFIQDLYIDDDHPEWVNGRCLDRSLPADAAGHTDCVLISLSTDDGSCRCDAPGFQKPAADALAAAKNWERFINGCDVDGKPACDDYCACEVVQKTGDALQTCQQQGGALTDGAGWCYVEPDAGIGNPAVTLDCPHFLHESGAPNMRLVLECAATTLLTPHPVSGPPGGMGAPCTPQEEFSPRFSGFAETEVTIESQSPSCSTGFCLVANFRGRTTCPYGQPPGGAVTATVDPSLGPDERCYLPGASNDPANEVTVTVNPQLLSRSPEKSVYCSCRCDGPAGEGPFCACPTGFECSHLVDGYGTAANAQFTGSYCTKSGTAIADPTRVPKDECRRGSPAPCDNR